MRKKEHVAVRETQKVVSLKMDATFFFERAVRSLDRNKYDKAIKYFRRAIDFEPENPVNHCNLAGILSEVGNYSESNQILQKVVDEVDPSMTECYFYMANNYANMEEFEAAEKAIVRYLENDPVGHYVDESEEMMEFLSVELDRPVEQVNIKSREGFMEHDKARSMLEEGRFAEAVKILKRLTRKYPDFLAARNNLALAYYYMGLFGKAMDTIHEVLEMESGNLHALCNLAIFYQHLGEREKLDELTAMLRRIVPFHEEHAFKLATTMGILNEHESAYQLFKRLLKSGLADSDPSLHHYTAVACCNTGRWMEAQRHWHHTSKLDPESEIPGFYLNLLQKRNADDPASKPNISYHYHLPFEEQFRIMEKASEELPETLRKDPLVRSSFFWALRHGDTDMKLQVIQAFGMIADNEVKEALGEFLLDPEETDYLKKIAVFVLRSIGVKAPLPAFLDGKKVLLPSSPYAPNLPIWEPEWEKVLDIAYVKMGKRYDLVQQHDLETLWIEFLTRVYPKKPRMTKIEGWAAALEYWTAKMHRRSISYEEVATRYGLSVSTVRTCARYIDEACELKKKMSVIYHGMMKE